MDCLHQLYKARAFGNNPGLGTITCGSLDCSLRQPLTLTLFFSSVVSFSLLSSFLSLRVWTPSPFATDLLPPFALRPWPSRLLGPSQVGRGRLLFAPTEHTSSSRLRPRLAPEPNTHTHSVRQARVVPSSQYVLHHRRSFDPRPQNRELQEALVLTIRSQRNPPRLRRSASSASSVTPIPAPKTRPSSRVEARKLRLQLDGFEPNNGTRRSQGGLA